MEFIPETAAALAALDETSDGSRLGDRLTQVSRRVRDVVPTCWGMSLSVVSEGLTFTLVTDDRTIAALDGVQYLQGGPCVDAVDEDRDVRLDDLTDPLDEQAWQGFAQSSAAAGVRSTLSFPLREGMRVIGGVNLYASSAGAFAGHEGELTGLLGGWATETVSNADLSFRTRETAALAPARLAERDLLAQATGMMMAAHGGTPEEALARLTAAAGRAGTSVSEVARAVLLQQQLDL
jgi:hypothetical protein